MFSLSVFASSAIAYASDDYLGQLLAIAKILHTNKSEEWQHILYYSKDFKYTSRSIVDDDKFFLAKDGKTNSESELLADIQAFFETPATGSNANLHAICKFPRRFEWIRANLQVDLDKLPKVECSEFNQWLERKNFVGISLVFSSSYPNNPSSLFGHTFLHLHRQAGLEHSKLLDEAINFSAYPDTENPLIFSIKGITGMFPGFFSITPYYFKVQEYSNSDSRDLWEYKLNLTSEDVANTLRALWEMDSIRINYYYFDENCSQVMLHFLQAVQPKLNLVTWQFWVIPTDTVKSVVRQNQMIDSVVYRPSAFSRFLIQYRYLNESERKYVDAIVQAKDSDAAFKIVLDSPKESQPQIVDTTLEYIDYDERLAGASQPVKYLKLRNALLSLRSKLPILEFKAGVPPKDEQPDIGHDSSRIGLEAGIMGRSEYFNQLHWRPALHDKMSSDAGYAAGLGIDFFDVYLRHRPKSKKIDIKEFYLIRIMSLPNLESIVKRPAWNLSIGTDLDYSCEFKGNDQLERDPCRTYFIKGGVGVSGAIHHKAIGFYSMVNLALGHNDQLNGGIYGEPALDSGLIWKMHSQFKFNASVLNKAMRGRESMYRVRHELSVRTSYEIKKNSEIRLSGLVHQTGYREILSSYYWYF